jgi:basic amino acid/polyamine antiporter, APA family
MARRRQQVPLGGFVGAGGVFGTAYAHIGTSIYLVLGGIALYALGATPVVMLLVGLVIIATGWSYAEASAALPEASGAASFARRAFDPMTGFVTAWALLLDFVVVVAITCTVVPHYLGAVWPQLQETPYDILIGVGLVLILVALNVFGLNESARLSALVAVLGLATIVVLLGVGLFTLLKPGEVLAQIDWGSAPTWGHLLYALPLAAAAFVGLDAVSSRAESARHPGRDVPLAMNVVLPLIVILGTALAIVSLSAMPVSSNTVPVDKTTGLTVPVPVVPGAEPDVYVFADDPRVRAVVPVVKEDSGYVIPAQKPTGSVAEVDGELSTRLNGTLLGSAYLLDPLMGLIAGLPDDLGWLEDLLRPWVAVLASLTLLLAANAVVGGSARIVYSLARHQQLPAFLGRIDAARMTPYAGIALFGLAAIALLLPRDPGFLFGLFGFGATLAFTMVSLSVVALRYRERTLARPFVVPLNVRVGEALLPLPSVAGAAATAVLWVLFVATHPTGRLLGFVWLAAGLAVYVVHRRAVGRPLMREPEEAQVPATALSDVDYERILVPVDGTRLGDEMMVLGCQLASEKGAAIDAVYVVEVPMELPLDAPPEDARARGRFVLDAAMAIAGEFGVEAWPHLVTSRRAGRAIVDTAVEWDSDVVILGELKKTWVDGSLFGDTVTFVMRHAPHEVLLNFVPADYPMRGSAAEFDAGRPTASRDESPADDEGE